MLNCDALKMFCECIRAHGISRESYPLCIHTPHAETSSKLFLLAVPLNTEISRGDNGVRRKSRPIPPPDQTQPCPRQLPLRGALFFPPVRPIWQDLLPSSARYQ